MGRNVAYEACLKAGWLPKPQPAQIVIRGQKVALGDDDVAAFAAADLRAEARLDKLVVLPVYRKATLRQQVAMLSRAYQAARDRVKHLLRVKHTKHGTA